jgi:NAD+ synthase (glutamine-hydrolysing)
MHGFHRIAVCVPELKVADVDFNVRQIVKLAEAADAEEAAVALFPELSLTGYTCADLFFQRRLQEAAADGLRELAERLASSKLLFAVGLPHLHKGRLYNCAAVVQSGKLLGLVPKTLLPNYREFYERRWFASGADVRCEESRLAGFSAPFGTGLIFSAGSSLKIGLEICEDLWGVLPPSSYLALGGATLLLNPSASNALVSKAGYRRELVRQQSARCLAAYAYASAGVHESTTDLVYGGHALIAENGALLAESKRFERKSSLVLADIDCERLEAARVSESSFKEERLPEGVSFQEIPVGPLNEASSLRRAYSPTPFVPSRPEERAERCEEIFHIQSSGLAKRLSHTGLKKAVVGVSGGLDSTLALLVMAETFKLLGRSASDIVAITMPGFGTTGRTYKNAVELIKLLGAELREIDIKDACLLHFSAIGHDQAKLDVTYENVQARERTQLLMDVANREGGLVVGTGDLSEIALGWSTYNGDHMSMYAVNCGVPKTLIRYLIDWVADNSSESLRKVLLDIADTPVTPELLPKGADDSIVQCTEDILGPYEIHDFLLYHTVKYGATPEKLKLIAAKAFEGRYPAETLAKAQALFFKRFFQHQFKRSCIPDGPKVGSICLSPRGDWRMPSDASPSLWL